MGLVTKRLRMRSNLLPPTLASALFRFETNQGAQAARNAGARAARGKWLSFLDSDDEFLPRSLEMPIETAAIENVEVVHSDCYILRPDMRQELYNPPVLRGHIYSELLSHPGPMFPAMLMSANSFYQIGGLDETIVAYQRMGHSYPVRQELSIWVRKCADICLQLSRSRHYFKE